MIHMHPDVTQVIERLRLTDDVFEKGRIIKYLMKEKGLRMKDIGELLEIQPSYLAHFLRLNKLPEIIIDGYYAKQVSASHLFIIARLHDYVTMMTVYEKVLSENLTSPQTENVVRELLYDVKAEGERLTDDEVDRFERLISRKLGTDVDFKITQTRVKGKFELGKKGNLADTTKMLRKLYKLLSSE